jgi:hypothetical protein
MTARTTKSVPRHRRLATATIAGLALAFSAGLVATNTAPPAAANAADPLWDGPLPLTIVPASGPVGTTVRITGQGCAVDDQPIVLAFNTLEVRHPAGEVLADANNRFETTFVIPDFVPTVENSDVGVVTPGQYGIQTVPPSCVGFFTVTGPPPPAAPAATPVAARPRLTG